MTIFILKRRLLINNYIKFFVFINIINVDKHVDRLIYIKKIIFLSFYFVINVFIQIRNNFCLSIDKNYIFYSKINFELKLKNYVYSYIVNINIFMIQIRNIIEKIYIISRHVKLNRILDYKKKDYYLTNSKNIYLTIKSKKQIFRNFFNLVLTKLINVFIFVFELIFNLIIASYYFIIELL